MASEEGEESIGPFTIPSDVTLSSTSTAHFGTTSPELRATTGTSSLTATVIEEGNEEGYSTYSPARRPRSSSARRPVSLNDDAAASSGHRIAGRSSPFLGRNPSSRDSTAQPGPPGKGLPQTSSEPNSVARMSDCEAQAVKRGGSLEGTRRGPTKRTNSPRHSEPLPPTRPAIEDEYENSLAIYSAGGTGNVPPGLDQIANGFHDVVGQVLGAVANGGALRLQESEDRAVALRLDRDRSDARADAAAKAAAAAGLQTAVVQAQASLAVRVAGENIQILHEKVRMQAGQAATNADEIRDSKLKLAALEREAASHS